jgi:hypothetical protein
MTELKEKTQNALDDVGYRPDDTGSYHRIVERGENTGKLTR